MIRYSNFGLTAMVLLETALWGGDFKMQMFFPLWEVAVFTVIVVIGIWDSFKCQAIFCVNETEIDLKS